ncbi:MAG TPA: hypothetical protein VID27_03855, partial [Blastocatellia bacterium]
TRSLGWLSSLRMWLRLYKLFARIAFGSNWSHLIQADHPTAFRWGGIEPLDAPLFSANSGSTRSPNQDSCVRQRNPSAIKKLFDN